MIFIELLTSATFSPACKNVFGERSLFCNTHTVGGNATHRPPFFFEGLNSTWLASWEYAPRRRRRAFSCCLKTTHELLTEPQASFFYHKCQTAIREKRVLAVLAEHSRAPHCIARKPPCQHCGCTTVEAWFQTEALSHFTAGNLSFSFFSRPYREMLEQVAEFEKTDFKTASKVSETRFSLHFLHLLLTHIVMQ